MAFFELSENSSLEIAFQLFQHKLDKRLDLICEKLDTLTPAAYPGAHSQLQEIHKAPETGVLHKTDDIKRLISPGADSIPVNGEPVAVVLTATESSDPLRQSKRCENLAKKTTLRARECFVHFVMPTELSSLSSTRRLAGFSDIACLVHDTGTWSWHPDSGKRAVLDILGLVMLAYDAFTVPYILAWDVRMVGSWLIGLWITRIFWTIDIPITMITAYRKADQTVESRFKMIVWKYLRRWFLIDVVIVAVDWLPVGPGYRALRGLRALRAVRVLRNVNRWEHLYARLMLRFSSKELRLLLGICSLLFAIVWISHLFGYHLRRIPSPAILSARRDKSRCSTTS